MGKGIERCQIIPAGESPLLASWQCQLVSLKPDIGISCKLVCCERNEATNSGADEQNQARRITNTFIQLNTTVSKRHTEAERGG
jgi:hypothetical protein